MMKMLTVAFVCSMLVTGPISTMTINNDVLDELESLIKNYKDTSSEVTNKKENEMTKTKTATVNEQGLKVVPAAHARSCGIASRIAYKECNNQATTEDQKKQCAYLFVEKYSECYFESSLKEGSKDLHACTGSCTWNFDNCLVNSDKVEMFICMNGRNTCYNQCPWQNNVSQLEKRGRNNNGCHSKCEGYFDQCMFVIQNPSEIMICNANRGTCKKTC